MKPYPPSVLFIDARKSFDDIIAFRRKHIVGEIIISKLSRIEELLERMTRRN